MSREPPRYALLASQTTATLATWWCALNRHRWPALLIDLFPHVDEQAPHVIMRAIENMIGLERCLLEWQLAPLRHGLHNLDLVVPLDEIPGPRPKWTRAKNRVH